MSPRGTKIEDLRPSTRALVQAALSERAKQRGGEGSASPAKLPGRSHFSAKRTHCGVHWHPSKVEARVCGRLREIYDPARGAAGAIYLQVRLPLLSSSPTDSGRPLYFTIDFAIVAPGGRLVRMVDAKSGRRRSREWLRGKLAAQATYGLRVEEMD